MKNMTMTDDTGPSPEEARAAVQRILGWGGLAGSERLRGLLTFLAEETLAGRGDEIRAKTIALDHYGYSADELADREGVVRVDAGRLRRRLEEYYRLDGAEDPVLVALPKGSYRPQFEAHAVETAKPNASKQKTGALRMVPVALAAALVVVLGLATLFATLTSQSEPIAEDTRSPAERAAVFETSPARLQAINLADSGRDLIFPAVDPERLRAALIVFEAAIEADADFAGGHAGAAQVLATMSLLGQDPNPAVSQKARDSAVRALELAPGDAWSQEAMAWVEYVEGDCSSALERSDRAMRLSPLDRHIVEFDSLIGLFCGQFDRVIAETEAMLAALGGDTGFVFTNALGSARFHLGDDSGTIDAFEQSIARGGPTGPISMAYLMAAHYRLGLDTEARRLAKRFETSWPGFQADLVFNRLFDDPKFARELLEAMRGAGWAGG